MEYKNAEYNYSTDYGMFKINILTPKKYEVKDNALLIGIIEFEEDKYVAYPAYRFDTRKSRKCFTLEEAMNYITAYGENITYY